jgi:hypothetical protein
MKASELAAILNEHPDLPVLMESGTRDIFVQICSVTLGERVGGRMMTAEEARDIERDHFVPQCVLLCEDR